MQRLEIQIGERFGMLAIVSEAEKSGTYRMFKLKCDCGQTTIVRLSHLRRTVWPVRSCGCQQDRARDEIGDHRRTHGQSRTVMHRLWCSMRQRCNNPNCKSYPDYGGRGIKVCERWQTFENFLVDMGERPSGKHQLDRINNDGNYQPGNVQWELKNWQMRNRRKLRERSSQYRGVDFWKNFRWRARITTVDRKTRDLGLFDSELEAARAYDEAARPFGFVLNFPERIDP